MKYETPLTPDRLLRRYKRFLADIRLDTGEEITAHCANPGAMLGLLAENGRVWLSRSDKPGRKLPWSWEIVEADFGRGPEHVGINTAHPNAIVAEAIAAGFFERFRGYDRLRREVKYGRNSRVDILLEGDGLPPLYVEIKNVHMMRKPGIAEFPDSVTARGAKHLGELADMVAQGHRAVMVYLIQMRADEFALAADVDPAYAAAFDRAVAAGVEVLAVCCDVTPEGIVIARNVPFASSPLSERRRPSPSP
jgi:sugar fermentation stimulation protein A